MVLNVMRYFFLRHGVVASFEQLTGFVYQILLHVTAFTHCT